MADVVSINGASAVTLICCSISELDVWTYCRRLQRDPMGLSLRTGGRDSEAVAPRDQN
jgi:hypothetical protein